MPERSGILEWNDENIQNTPSGAGVFVLTNSPTNGTTIDLECVGNLKLSLQTRLNAVDLPQPKFFYWYSTSDLETAKELSEKLRLYYGLSS